MKNVMNRFKMRSTIVVMVAIFGLFGAILMAPQAVEAQMPDYSVNSYSDSSYSIPENNFVEGDTVFGEGVKSTRHKGTIKIVYKNSNGDVLKDDCPENNGRYISTTCDFVAPVGDGIIELQRRGERHCNWSWNDWQCHYTYDWDTKADSTFSVSERTYCGDDNINKPNSNGFYEQCDNGDENGKVPEVGYGEEENYCSNSCANETAIGPKCGDKNVDVKYGEDCDGEEGCSEECTWEPITINASKIICDDESQLPNWATGENGAPSMITASTANDYVANNDGCKIAQWEFQWEYSNDLGNWHSFGDTTTIYDLNNTTEIRLREVENSDYIPFTFVPGHTNDSDDVSAEFYCHKDVKHYDNYDFIRGAEYDENYYCVGFNALTPTCGDGEINQDSEECDGEKGCSEECTWLPGKILVSKYNDLNKDGKRKYGEGAEPGLKDWTFRIYEKDGPQIEIDQTTGNSGWTTFKNLPLGDYTVCENMPIGWTSNDATIYNNGGNEYCKDVTVNPGDSTTVKFGNYETTFDIDGFKWSDLDMNGEFDCDVVGIPGAAFRTSTDAPLTRCEPKLSDWTIFIDENADGILNNEEQSAQTDKEGNYKFEGLEAGTYSVCEVQQDGWVQTYPENCHEVTLPISTVWATTVLDGPPPAPQTIKGFPFGNYQAFCGNSTIDEGEECDGYLGEGSLGQYCSQECTIEEWYFLTKTDNKETAEPGELSIYEITFGYTMEWPEPLTTGYIVDTVPDHFTVDEGTISDEGVYDDATRTITWQIGELVETHTFTFSGTIDAEMPEGVTTLLNTAKLYQQPMVVYTMMVQEMIVEELPEIDPILLLTATDETLVTAFDGPFLTIEKDVDATEAEPGETLNYTIIITNIGDQPAIDVVVDDILPEGLIYQDGTTTKQWVFDIIAPGASETIPYIAIIEDDATTNDYTNTASVGATGLETVEDDATTTIAEEVKIPIVEGVEALPSLTVDKTAGVEFANPGDTISYTIVVTNDGDAMAIDTILIDHIAAGMQFTDTVAPTHTWMLGDIAPGNSVTTTYDVIILKDNEPGVYRNTAEVWAQGVDNVFDTADVEVRSIVVLGEELPITGSSIMTFIYLIGSSLVITFSGLLLKLTVAKK